MCARSVGWVYIGCMGAYWHLKSAARSMKARSFWQFLAFASFFRPRTLPHRTELTFSVQTNNERSRGRSTASASTHRHTHTHKTEEKTSTKRTSTLVGTRSFHIFIFVLCLLQLCFSPMVFLLSASAFFVFFSCSFVATKLKSKHKVGYVVDISWLRARDNKIWPTERANRLGLHSKNNNK